MKVKLLLVSLLFVVGCLQGSTEAPTPTPAPDVITVLPPDKGAETYIRLYAKYMAQEAKNIAEKAKADEYKDITAVEDAWFTASASARIKANETLIKSMDAYEVDAKGRPGRDSAPLYELMAKGFERIK